MTLSVSGDSITFNDLSTLQTAPSGFGFKNRIINGDMRIDQRNAGASVNVTSASQQYVLDRFQMQSATDGTLAVQRGVVAPSGFVNSLKVTVSVADAALGAGQIARIRHKIEGVNASDFGFGTANASTITVSFWTRSSVVGLFAGYIANGPESRSFPFTYNITAANTWEQKTITIPGDTSGTWATDNTQGLELGFVLAAGTAFNGTASTWAGAGIYSVSGATNLLATSGATFYITGVQLEKGSTATAFDYRDYGRELIMCQRYHQGGGSTAASISAAGFSCLVFYNSISYSAGQTARATIQTRVTMRAAPTVAFADGSGNLGKVYFNAPNATASVFSSSQDSVIVVATAAATSSAFDLNIAYAFDAEL